MNKAYFCAMPEMSAGAWGPSEASAGRGPQSIRTLQVIGVAGAMNAETTGAMNRAPTTAADQGSF